MESGKKLLCALAAFLCAPGVTSGVVLEVGPDFCGDGAVLKNPLVTGNEDKVFVKVEDTWQPDCVLTGRAPLGTKLI